MCSGIKGAEGLGKYLEHVQKSDEEGKKIDIGDLQVFQVFEFLLDKVQKTTTIAVIEKCYAKFSYMPVDCAPAPPQKVATQKSKENVKKEVLVCVGNTSS